MRRRVTKALWRLAVTMSQMEPLSAADLYDALKAWYRGLPRGERSVERIERRRRELEAMADSEGGS